MLTAMIAWSGRIGSMSQRGISLVEVLISIALVALLIALAAPNFAAWIQSSQIRAASESMLAGLQLARGEAVRRNIPVAFTLTDSLTNSCAASTSGTSWVVSVDDPTGGCQTGASDTIAPRIVQVRSATTTPNAEVAATQATVRFNSLGQMTPFPNPGGDVVIDVTNSKGGSCATLASPNLPMRCLRLVVTSGGQIRMCDPARASGTPQGC